MRIFFFSSKIFLIEKNFIQKLIAKRTEKQNFTSLRTGLAPLDTIGMNSSQGGMKMKIKMMKRVTLKKKNRFQLVFVWVKVTILFSMITGNNSITYSSYLSFTDNLHQIMQEYDISVSKCNFSDPYCSCCCN